MLVTTGLFAAQVCAQPDEGPYRIERSVVAGGGGSLGGGTYQLRGTLSQSGSGHLSGSIYEFNGGFWPVHAGDVPSDRIFANGFDP